MDLIQKIALVAAVAAALTFIVRRAMSLDRAARIEDAEPMRPEPLDSDDLRVAQNSPL
jgi:hypothetical protein